MVGEASIRLDSPTAFCFLSSKYKFWIYTGVVRGRNVQKWSLPLMA